MMVLAATAAGFVLGLAYLAVLRATVRLILDGRGWIVPLALTLGRVGVAVGCLALAGRLGIMPLLGAFLGFLLARTLVLRAAGSAG